MLQSVFLTKSLKPIISIGVTSLKNKSYAVLLAPLFSITLLGLLKSVKLVSNLPISSLSTLILC